MMRISVLVVTCDAQGLLRGRPRPAAHDNGYFCSQTLTQSAAPRTRTPVLTDQNTLRLTNDSMMIATRNFVQYVTC